ncbi:hypothetical protein ACFSC4_09940 [Deinococcus malanensis]|uniref:hypothetical protein n=1 Tax=Deinococcus malanensis TaxID=1706855 RepID=UPI0036373E0F
MLLGSEGQTEVLADDLEGLLARIALGTFEDDGPLSSFLPFDDDGEEAQDLVDLASWLREQLGREDLEALVGVRGSYPDLQGWLDGWQASHVQAVREEAVFIRISELLSGYRPKESWQTANFRVVVVGEHYEAWHLRHGPQPFPEASALEALIREARTARATRIPGRGAWFAATVRLSHDGSVLVLGDFANEPDFQGDVPGTEQYDADLHLFPVTPGGCPGG